MRQTTIWLDNETQIQMSGPASTREKVINIKNDILNYRLKKDCIYRDTFDRQHLFK